MYNPSAVAVDTSSNPPILYVADANNHRVLAWQNPVGTSAGDLATKVIGQRDLFSGFAGGPGAPTGILTAAGLTLPSAVAVDSSGNLWVMDAGNNRILRFTKPLTQSGEFAQPDLVIGQKTATSGKDNNQGLPRPSEKTLSLRSSNAAGGAMVFDAQGNLWVADTYNHRILRFPKSNLSGAEPAADLVLGQSLFSTSNHTLEDYSHRADLDSMIEPVGLAVDARGGVYVSDKLLRVLYYPTPATGVLASRVLGIHPAPAQGQPNPTYPTEYSIGLVSTPQGTTLTLPAQGLFTSGNVLFVCDSIAHRIIRYNPSEQWASATPAAPSPAAVGVYGQDTMTTGTANRGQGQYKPGGNSLNVPVGGAFLNNDLWVVDNGNNRVLSLPVGAGTFDAGTATRVVGQKRFDTYAPNLVEGKELFVYNASGIHGTAVIVDKSSTPNRLWVADSQNNRVLGFKDARAVGILQGGIPTTEPDIVIGQPDKIKTGPNYPAYDPQVPSDQGLYAPTGVAVDKDGSLWVADSGNGRVLRFPAPFNQAAGAVQRANLVLGQSTFTFTVPDASSSTMGAPVSVVVFNNGDVAAADVRHSRVLLWKKPGAGDFSNGQSARAVLGQPDFFSTSASSTPSGLTGPRGMTVDTGDRLYVADAGNNRVVVYNSTGNIANGASGIIVSAGLNTPESVAVSAANGAIWVASGGNGYLYRYAEYSQLGTGPVPVESFQSNAPLAIALDSKDNLIVVEATNRISFFYGYVLYRNAANYSLSQNVPNNQGLASNSQSLTPGMYTVIARSPNTTPFAFTPGAASLPFPKQFGGVEVLVGGIPAPIWRLDNAYIVFLMPNNAPTSNTVEILVRDTTTGEILGSGTHRIGLAAPGFFTASQDGKGQISANNADGTVNSISNKAANDSIVTIWMNGYGHLDGAPDDGVPVGGALQTDEKPVIYVQAYQVPPDDVKYSGVSPQFPGLWQINFKLPKNGDKNAPVPGDRVPIIVLMRGAPSNVLGNDGGAFRVEDTWLPLNDSRITTIAIK